MIRFLLFRFLPRRLMPWLMVLEVVLLVWRWRKRDQVRQVAPYGVQTRSTRRA
jgi:hypothetical protein